MRDLADVPIFCGTEAGHEPSSKKLIPARQTALYIQPALFGVARHLEWRPTRAKAGAPTMRTAVKLAQTARA